MKSFKNTSKMNNEWLTKLLEEYRNSPKEFQATNYWKSYEQEVIDAIYSLDLNQLRSGKYPVLATFGFSDVLYYYHPSLSLWKKKTLQFIHNLIIKDRRILPYGLSVSDIQELAYHHCELVANSTNSIQLHNIEVSMFGNPQDVFEINGRKYSMSFMNYFIRYCFSNKHIAFRGDEIFVELGSGSGYQIEVLKKIYPKLTVLCFDLPAQIYLCEQYLINALDHNVIISTQDTINWNDLSSIEKGKVHLFGNWKFPLLDGFPFDVFWNAASFGEMESDIVKSYLSYIKGNAKWIYLLQARHGKETSGTNYVDNPITLIDYERLLSGYLLQEVHDAWRAHKKLSDSGGYFEGLWRKN